MLRNIFVLVVMGNIIACSQPKENADLIVHNALVYTVDEDFSVQEAFAVKNGIFLAVGSNQAILGNYNSENIVDAMGKPAYPGFNDAHCHFYGYGTNIIKRADLVGTKSFEEVIEKLLEHDTKFPGEWIEGRGWDQNDWKKKDFPDKELLDATFPDKPVYLIRIDGHAAVVNSEALKRAGITAETEITGGKVLVQNGNPTGVLIDNAMAMIDNVIPELSEVLKRKAIQITQENCFAVGLTSITDAGLEKNIVQLIDSLHKEGSLKMRINAMLSPSEENMRHFVANGPYITDYLTVRSVKLYADGALGSRGAKMIEPYSDDPGNTGMYMYPATFYMDICNQAFNNNFQVNTHAIGDAANRFVLETYSKFLEGKNNKRWRIEHAQVVHPDDFRRFGELSVIPSVQPTHATSDMYWAEDRVGAERIKGAYAFKQLLDENGWIPLGTDFPIESINPLYTFYAAVTRKDFDGWPEGGYQMENALTREEALRGMTIWAAKASFEEDKKGSIETGKVADFVMLKEDIITIEILKVPEIKVISTYVAGIKVYQTGY